MNAIHNMKYNINTFRKKYNKSEIYMISQIEYKFYNHIFT